jgi:hypothetical protein
MRFVRKCGAVFAIVMTVAVMAIFVTPKVSRSLAADEQTIFVASQSCTFGNSDTCTIPSLHGVPKDKIAVIESVSGVCVTQPPSTTREFQLNFSGPAGVPVQMSFPPSPGVPITNGTIEVSVTALNMKTYAFGGPAGSAISFSGFASAEQSTSLFPATCHFTVSGYTTSPLPQHIGFPW